MSDALSVCSPCSLSRNTTVKLPRPQILIGCALEFEDTYSRIVQQRSISHDFYAWCVGPRHTRHYRVYFRFRSAEDVGNFANAFCCQPEAVVTWRGWDSSFKHDVKILLHQRAHGLAYFRTLSWTLASLPTSVTDRKRKYTRPYLVCHGSTYVMHRNHVICGVFAQYSNILKLQCKVN